MHDGARERYTRHRRFLQLKPLFLGRENSITLPGRASIGRRELAAPDDDLGSPRFAVFQGGMEPRDAAAALPRLVDASGHTASITLSRVQTPPFASLSSSSKRY